MFSNNRRATKTDYHRPRRRTLAFEPLCLRIAMTAEGQSYALDQSLDVSELMGEITGSIQWGDGTSASAAIVTKPVEGPLRVRIDYSLDATGFFQNAARRSLLQTVVDSIASRFSDTLSAIQPSGGSSWEAKFNNPSTGNPESKANLTIAANELVVFVGARSLNGPAALGNRGGFSASSTQQSFLDTVRARGQAGALTTPQTDVGPWGGAITFDTARNWYFGTSLSGIGPNQLDFVSIASHEFLHVLGFGTTGSFDNRVINGKFTGTSATQLYGAQVPMGDGDHFADSVLYQGRRPIMISGVGPAERLMPTRLDLAAMDDIGWQLISPSARVTGSKVFGDNGTFGASIALQGAIGTKTFPIPISITNAAPTFIARGNGSATTGIAVTLNRIGQFTDPGFGAPLATPPKSETFTYRIQWGDGLSDNGTATVESIGNASSPTRGFFNGTHTYSAPGTYTVTLTVTDDDGGSTQQQFQIVVDAPPILSLSINKNSFSEASGAGVAILTISRPASFSSGSLTVQLVSSDPSEAILPLSANFPAGSTSITVGVTAVDDALFDGNQTVEFSASATNFQTGRLSVTVTDYQPISFAAERTQLHEDDPNERSTPVSIGIRSPAPPGGVLVSLTSMPSGIVTFPASVLIPADATQIEINVSAIDDLLPQRLRTVTLEASGNNLISKSLTITVIDSDPFRWTNPAPAFQMDVNDDRSVDPLDVLAIINELNASGARVLDPIMDVAPPYVDTNPDGRLDPLDVLVVINAINSR
jgi:PKD repeat protein